MEEIEYRIRYYKLFDLLNRKGLSKGQFAELTGLSSATVAKLSNNKPVNTTIINRICAALNCQPGDIMEYIPTPPEE
ncbi:MAG: hypothetical protein H6Q67_384 [Firmicutes bacterium]|nr:hypothetical protein [Bacillota bacterium]